MAPHFMAPHFILLIGEQTSPLDEWPHSLGGRSNLRIEFSDLNYPSSHVSLASTYSLHGLLFL